MKIVAYGSSRIKKKRKEIKEKEKKETKLIDIIRKIFQNFIIFSIQNK